MAKQIPTTTFVPPFPAEKGMERDQWSRAVSGFCNGAQAVKIDDEVDGKVILGVRTGSVVHLQGHITISGTFCKLDVLPVAPRTNGFINAYNSAGEITGIAITKGSKSIDMCSLDDGEYYVTGSYLASLKERI